MYVNKIRKIKLIEEYEIYIPENFLKGAALYESYRKCHPTCHSETPIST